MYLSIVTTLYRSSSYINEFYERMIDEALKITQDFEIIFVNDGSPDDSVLKAANLFNIDKRIRVIDLSRNYGHHKAIMTGLAHAKGDFIFLIDIDLEEEPELLSVYWKKMQSDEKIDVVYGVQAKRKGGFVEKITGKIFYKIFNMLSNVKVPDNIITARLFKKHAVEMIVQYEERELCLGCIFQDIGLTQVKIEINKLSTSPTTYSFRAKLRLFLNSIISFSNKGLFYIFYLGIIITLFAVVFICKLIIDRLILDTIVDGWTSILVSVWFFGGLILAAIGVIGLYLSQVYTEVKHRPYTLIKKIYEHK